jgi:biopolymer transport protein ExbB
MIKLRYTGKQRTADKMERTNLLSRRRAHRLAALAVALALIVPAAVIAQTTPTTPPATPAPAASESASAVSAAPSVTPAASDTATPATGAPPPVQPAPVIALTLPRDLSPWGMFMAADIVVKAVMIGLVFASVLSWTIWFAKALELIIARGRMRRVILALGQARSWAEAARLQDQDGSAAALIRAANTELKLSSEAMASRVMQPDGVKERIVSRLERAEAAASRAMLRGTSILATIGATAPFVGLFGTVWGIMNSFIGISKAHTTNLAVVAPGIAEALLATALGLVAAIPAVVMYNFFSRWIAGYRAQHADASAEIMRIVSRDFDRGAFDERPARRGVAAAE